MLCGMIQVDPFARLPGYVELTHWHAANVEQLFVAVHIVLGWKAGDEAEAPFGRRDWVLGMAGNGKTTVFF